MSLAQRASAEKFKFPTLLYTVYSQICLYFLLQNKVVKIVHCFNQISTVFGYNKQLTIENDFRFY